MGGTFFQGYMLQELKKTLDVFPLVFMGLSQQETLNSCSLQGDLQLVMAAEEG